LPLVDNCYVLEECHLHMLVTVHFLLNTEEPPMFCLYFKYTPAVALPRLQHSILTCQMSLVTYCKLSFH
jgi:hypothetical protein